MSRLWYRQPAGFWEWEEALPVGNGRLGGMVFGRTDYERIQLNEESIWYGKPLDRNNPDALGNLEKIRELMNNYQDLILENQMVLDELEQECQEKINENMAYALQYMDSYDYRMNLVKLKKEVNNIILIYGLCDMVNRAMTLVKYFTPNFGTEYYDVLYSCFCRHRKMADMEIMLELGLSRASFYRKKKAALRYLGYYFFEIVVPQSANKRYKPSFPETEE